MEVFQTENFYIFVKKEKSLWWNRTTSEFSVKAGNYSVNYCHIIISSIRAAIAACQSFRIVYYFRCLDVSRCVQRE